MAGKILTINKLKDLVSPYKDIIPISSAYASRGTYCPTYQELMSGQVCPVASSTSAGITITSYTIGDSATSYRNSQLVCEADIAVIGTTVLTLTGNINGWTINLNSDDYDKTVTATSNTVSFTVKPGNYTYIISHPIALDIELNPTAYTIGASVLNAVITATAVTTSYPTVANTVSVGSSNQTVNVTTTSNTTRNNNWKLVITSGSNYANTNGQSIAYIAPNPSTTSTKDVFFDVVHLSDNKVKKSGKVSQLTASQRTLTFTNLIAGTVVTVNDMIQTATTSTLNFAVADGSAYTYSAYNPTVLHEISVYNLEVDYDIKDVDCCTRCNNISYKNFEPTSTGLISGDKAISLILEREIVEEPTTLSTTSTNLGRINGKYFTFSSINETGSNKVASVTATCVNNTTVTKSFTVTQKTNNVSRITAYTITIDAFSYTNASADGGSVGPDTEYSVIAVYSDGHKEVVTKTTPVNKVFTKISGDGIVDALGRVTYDENTGDTTRETLVSYTVSLMSDASIKATVNATCLQEKKSSPTPPTPPTPTPTITTIKVEDLTLSYPNRVGASGGDSTPSVSYKVVIYFSDGTSKETTAYTPKFEYSKTSGAGTVNASSGVVNYGANSGSSARSTNVSLTAYIDGYKSSGSDTASASCTQNGQDTPPSPTIVGYSTTIDTFTYSDVTASGGNSSPTLSYSLYAVYSDGQKVKVDKSTVPVTVTYTDKGGSGTFNTSTHVVAFGANTSTSQKTHTVNVKVYPTSYSSSGGTKDATATQYGTTPPSTYTLTAYTNYNTPLLLNDVECAVTASGSQWYCTKTFNKGTNVTVKMKNCPNNQTTTGTPITTSAFTISANPTAVTWGYADIARRPFNVGITMTATTETPYTSYTYSVGSGSVTVNSNTSITVNYGSSSSTGTSGKTTSESHPNGTLSVSPSSWGITSSPSGGSSLVIADGDNAYVIPPGSATTVQTGTATVRCGTGSTTVSLSKAATPTEQISEIKMGFGNYPSSWPTHPITSVEMTIGEMNQQKYYVIAKMTDGSVKNITSTATVHFKSPGCGFNNGIVTIVEPYPTADTTCTVYMTQDGKTSNDCSVNIKVS